MSTPSLSEWEESMLASPLANKVSGEDTEHVESDPEYLPNRRGKCRCQRCIIIRIKKRRAFRFPMTKCPGCGKLFFSIFTLCEQCRKETT